MYVLTHTHYIYMYKYTHMCVYIYIERERLQDLEMLLVNMTFECDNFVCLMLNLVTNFTFKTFFYFR